VRAFPSGNAKPSSLAEQLKTALAGDTSIKVNEIRYVAEDASVAGIKVAAQLSDFIHLDAGVSRQRGFQLFGEGGRLGVSAGKGAHKSRELRLRKSRGKMNARDSRGDQ